MQAQGLGHVLVNVGQANEKHEVVGSEIRVVGDRAVEGKLVTKSFCGGAQYTTWFRIEFDRPFKRVRHLGQGRRRARLAPQRGRAMGSGEWRLVEFRPASVAQRDRGQRDLACRCRRRAREPAMRRDRQDGKLLGFEQMRAQAQAAWRKELGSVRIEGGTADDRIVFHTALYHALLQPMTGSDADGRYRGYDEAIHRADGWTYYEYFSLWDTYRSQNQLLADPAAAACA